MAQLKLPRSHPPFLTSLLLLALATSLLFRFYRLDAIPSGLFVDEASIGYNAYTLLHLGQDEHGFSLPIFFRAFGEYKSPVFIYSLPPLFAIFGVSIFTLRLGAALWGFLTLVAVFLLSLKLTSKPNLALLATLILSLNPVHFALSRVAFEIIAYPVFLLLSFLFLYTFTLKHRLRDWYTFVALTTFTFYTYTSAKFLAVATLLLAIWLYRHHLHLRHHIRTLILALVVLLPALSWEWLFPGSLTARFDTVSIFSHQPMSQALLKLPASYLSHFHPDFLLFLGDENYRHSAVWHGLMLWSTLPLFALGVFSLAKSKTPFTRFLLGIFLLGFLPSAVTTQAPHILRSYTSQITALIIIVFGLNYLLRTRFSRLLLHFLGFFIVESVFFLSYFFTLYPMRSAHWFEADLTHAFETLVHYPPPYHLSSVFYPGSLSSVQFVQATVQPPNLVLSSPPAALIDPYAPFPVKPGSYLFDISSCAHLPATLTSQPEFSGNLSLYCLYVVTP